MPNNLPQEFYGNGGYRKRVTLAKPGNNPWIKSNEAPQAPAPPKTVAPVPNQQAAQAVKRRGGRRDIAAQLAANFASKDSLKLFEAAENERWDKPFICPSTRAKHEAMKRAWIAYITYSFDEETALQSLTEGASIAPIGVLRSFFYLLATSGESNFEGRTGWSFITLKKSVHAILGMFYHAGVETPSDQYKLALSDTVEKWTREDGVIHTEVKKRATIRPMDYLTILATILGPELAFETNFQRIQFLYIIGFMWELGCRTGVFAEPKEAKGLAICVRCADVQVVFREPSQWGAEITIFFTFNYQKGMKYDESMKQQSIRSVPGNQAHLDSILPFLACGIHLGFWEEDILPWLMGDAQPPHYPYLVKVKDDFKTTSITKAAKTVYGPIENVHQPASTATPVPQQYRALTFNGLQHNLLKLKNVLGWDLLVGKSFRYTWCGQMVDKLDPTFIKYFMGHRSNSAVAMSVYQNPDRNVDLTAHRHDNMQHDTTLVDFHSSVAWETQDFNPARATILKKRLESDPTMTALITAFSAADLALFKLSGNYYDYSTDTIAEDHKEAFEEAQDAYMDILQQYNALYNADITSPTSINVMLENKNVAEIQRTTASQEGTAMPTELALRLQQNLDTLGSSHPLLPLVLTDQSKNARKLIIQHHLRLLKEDQLHEQNICRICYYREPDTLPGGSANPAKTKNWGHGVGLHMFSCEKALHEGTKQRCHLCAAFVDTSRGSEEFSEHFSECFVKKAPQMALAALQPGNGIPLASKLQLGSRHSITVWFCPSASSKEPRSISVTCKLCPFHHCAYVNHHSITMSQNTQMQHMMGHFKRNHAFDNSVSCFCPFFECEDKTKFNITGIISHLHNKHRYPLLKCLCENEDHHGPDSPLVLQASSFAAHLLLYEEDVKLVHGRTGQWHDSVVCLSENSRRSEIKKKSQKDINKFLDVSPSYIP